ncbi:solute carrier family 25 member 40-like [Chrysoperla carnea]|uniref:solute carrier family 25 member 40-like n=1 Tax=Chrysoperla carnea TaxID=189513 RepID=UPI001D06A4FD|nr:solute carrier family 25 member 40-like [Chrysoperla carnea]
MAENAGAATIQTEIEVAGTCTEQGPHTVPTSDDIPIDFDDPKYRATPMQQVLSSCTGALLTSFLVTPLDVIKIRLQAQQKSLISNRCYLYCNGLMDHLCPCDQVNGIVDPRNRSFVKPVHFNGTIDAFYKITKYEGVSALWSGLSPTLVLAVPTTILYFVSYEQIRLSLKDWYNKRNVTNGERIQPAWIPIVAGGSARIFSATIVSPLELIRTKMQSAKLKYADVAEALQLLIKTDGAIGLWKGLGPTLLRDVPFSAVYWTVYEFLKNDGCIERSFFSSFMYGAIAGSVAATITVPFDVVKTHQQIELGEKEIYTDRKQPAASMSNIFRKIYRNYGVRGLFAGLTPRVIKVAPACAIMIATFEHGKKFFHRNANETEPDIKKKG